MKRVLLPGLVLAVCAGLAWNFFSAPLPEHWTEQERALIRSMALDQLPALPPDPSNQAADSGQAAELGHRLFFDTRLSSSQSVSCATCHRPELYFTDGLALAVGVGVGDRHTPSLVGLSHSPWFYWDGRKDSQWSQALAPLESAHEHNSDRLQIARLITGDDRYRRLYEAGFGGLPEIPGQPLRASPLGEAALVRNWELLNTATRHDINRVFSNVGKALAAYQRKLMPGVSRFDDYAMALAETTLVAGNGELSRAELGGLKLFIGKGQCVTCHNGPLFTNHDFHNTGVFSLRGELPPMGRYDGIRLARQDRFNCLGSYSDAEPGQCLELRFAQDDESVVGAHKTPTLRNVAATAPYMHGGQFQSLAQVMQHYNGAPVSMLSHNEAKPLNLRPVELRQLEAFLHTLTAPPATAPEWLASPD